MCLLPKTKRDVFFTRSGDSYVVKDSDKTRFLDSGACFNARVSRLFKGSTC